MKKMLLKIAFLAIFIFAGGILSYNFSNKTIEYGPIIWTLKEQVLHINNDVNSGEESSLTRLVRSNDIVAKENEIKDVFNAAYDTSDITCAEQNSIQAPLPDLEPVPTMTPHKGNIINILLLGLDRNLIQDKTMDAFRTDTISIASINLGTGKIQVLSIPRDTYVYIPHLGRKDKINTAYVWGGMGNKGIASTIKVVNSQIKYSTIDYYFCIDMEPVPAIVDALGGVEVNVDKELAGKGIGFKEGMQLLDGKKSLAYIRYRYTKNGDIDRIRHQQIFCSSLLGKLKDRNEWLTDIKLLFKYSKYIKTNMSLLKMLSVSAIIDKAGDGAISFNIVPGRSAKQNGIWYWFEDESKTDRILKQMFQS